MTPTARTLDALRRLGFTADPVERVLRRIKRDYLGCIDVIAVTTARVGALGIQATDSTHLANRKRKSEAEERLLVWLCAGNRFEVWAWKGPLVRIDALERAGSTGWDWHEGEYVSVAELVEQAS